MNITLALAQSNGCLQYSTQALDVCLFCCTLQTSQSSTSAITTTTDVSFRAAGLFLCPPLLGKIQKVS